VKPAAVVATFVTSVTVLFLTAPPLYAANDDPDSRVLRAERWLKATLSHQPGAKDDAVIEVSLWSDAELRALFVDESALAQLMLNPMKASVKIPTIGGRRQPPPYSTWQIRRLRVLACAASGELHRDECTRVTAEDEIDPTLKRLAQLAASGAAGSFVLRRGAILHGDIAMFGPEPVMAPGGDLAGDGGRIRVQLSDGESNGFNAAPIHWEMARQLLDYVKPSATDTFVSRWYAATAMWMQDREQHDTAHLKHARELLPDDPDILFLSGCQQETYAGPAIQSAVRSAVLPQGFTLDVASEATALRDAEAYFRRTLALDPQHPDARIHLGHVLLARGRAPEAADELRQVDTTDRPQLSQYFHVMFLGAAEEAVARFDQARDAYARASAIFPGAQSPYLALSALATRRGDRATALKEAQRLFDLPIVAREPDDPWWTYHEWQARGVDALFEHLYAPFAGERK
jgi:tetratricopeptide (TPR) repeat protein